MSKLKANKTSVLLDTMFEDSNNMTLNSKSRYTSKVLIPMFRIENKNEKKLSKIDYKYVLQKLLSLCAWAICYCKNFNIFYIEPQFHLSSGRILVIFFLIPYSFWEHWLVFIFVNSNQILTKRARLMILIAQFFWKKKYFGVGILGNIFFSEAWEKAWFLLKSGNFKNSKLSSE